MTISKEDFIRAVENSKSSDELGLVSALPIPPGPLYCLYPKTDSRRTGEVVKHLGKLIYYYAETSLGRKETCKAFARNNRWD